MQTTPERKFQPDSWQTFFGIIICVLIVVIGIGLSHRQRVAIRGEENVWTDYGYDAYTGQVDSQVAAVEITPATNPPEWMAWTATPGASLRDDYLYFTMDGQQTQTLEAGTDYYLVDRERYENFVPKSVDDLILLQLPDATLRPLTQRSTFVVLAAPWKVPDDVSGQLVYQVDSWDGYDIPAGEYVSGPVTVWMVPWAQRAGMAHDL